MRRKLFSKGSKKITRAMILGMYLNEKYDFDTEIDEDDVILINPNIESLLELKHQLRHVTSCRFILSKCLNGTECVVRIPNGQKNLACHNLQFNLALGLDGDGNLVELD